MSCWVLCMTYLPLVIAQGSGGSEPTELPTQDPPGNGNSAEMKKHMIAMEQRLTMKILNLSEGFADGLAGLRNEVQRLQDVAGKRGQPEDQACKGKEPGSVCWWDTPAGVTKLGLCLSFRSNASRYEDHMNGTCVQDPSTLPCEGKNENDGCFMKIQYSTSKLWDGSDHRNGHRRRGIYGKNYDSGLKWGGSKGVCMQYAHSKHLNKEQHLEFSELGRVTPKLHGALYCQAPEVEACYDAEVLREKGSHGSMCVFEDPALGPTKGFCTKGAVPAPGLPDDFSHEMYFCDAKITYPGKWPCRWCWEEEEAQLKACEGRREKDTCWFKYRADGGKEQKRGWCVGADHGKMWCQDGRGDDMSPNFFPDPKENRPEIQACLSGALSESGEEGVVNGSSCSFTTPSGEKKKGACVEFVLESNISSSMIDDNNNENNDNENSLVQIVQYGPDNNDNGNNENDNDNNDRLQTRKDEILWCKEGERNTVCKSEDEEYYPCRRRRRAKSRRRRRRRSKAKSSLITNFGQ